MLKTGLKLFILSLVLCSAVPAFSKERIIDNAGLLSPNQKTILDNRINSISEKYNFDIVIVTERNISSMNPMEYADDYYDFYGYGFGQDRDGCLFLQVTDTRDYWISTSGKAIKILNDYAFDKLESDLLKFLSAGNNYEAYNTYLQNWSEFLELDTRWGRSYNFFYRWNIVLVIAAWIISAVIGIIIILSWKGSMNTAIAKTQAAAYVVPGSLSYKVKSDNFLYSTVTK
ncbi:MAG: TPM domain-containing protein, partial [Treponema sp.]|nr:TPM domain-containing protein [Treponema sp.]